MSQTDPMSKRCVLGPGLTVERRVATAAWNEQERERIIAMKAYEVFCSRGCEHGFHLADWLRAEQELSPATDDLLLAQSEAGFEVSIARRAEEACIVLSISRASILVLWTTDVDACGEAANARQSSLNMMPLPETVDPERAEVVFHDDRVRLRLPYADKGSAP